MFRRFALIAAAVAAALGITVLAQVPAHASIYSQNCREFRTAVGDLHTYCAWIQYRNMAGSSGMIADQWGAFVTGPSWENGDPPAITCTSLLVKNGDTGDVKWSRFSGCNVISTHDPAGPYTSGDGIEMPNANSITVSYTGYLRLDGFPDPGNKTVSVTVHD